MKKKCNHQFWVDGNPPGCFNCGKTKEELYEEYIRTRVLSELTASLVIDKRGKIKKPNK